MPISNNTWGNIMLDHTFVKFSPETIPHPAPDCPIDCSALPEAEALLRAGLASKHGCSQSPTRLYERIPLEIRRRIECETGEKVSADPESYVVCVEKDGIDLYAISRRGLFHAVQTLLRVWEENTLHPALIYDCPTLPLRCLKVLLPPPTEEGLNDFRLLAGVLARWRFNAVMIELGGAMEYFSHPEIAEGWLEYAAFMNEYPGKAQKYQDAYDYEKNSIHATNGGGQVWTQEQLKQLIAVCREHFLEIIPEIPSLSHVDYLLARHPELSERGDVPFPETYCPSNPASYRLLFDLIEETVELFHPRRINIGHDEFYSIGLCERCRTRRPEEIFADDVNRIADFLERYGVKCLLASDKLLPAKLVNGKPAGGSECAPSGKNTVPPTHPAIDLVRNDLGILHWYWSVDRKLEELLFRHNFEVYFWNFTGSSFPEWRRRSSHPNVKGIIISNWGALDLATLQRNGIFCELAFASALCWNKTLDSVDNRRITDFAAMELDHCRRALRGPEHYLAVEHHTDHNRKFQYYYDGNFFEEQDYLLGHHVFRDRDSGAEYRLPVVFGSNITHPGVEPYPCEDTAAGRELDQYRIDPQFQEVLFGTLPVRDEDGTLFFRCEYPHPMPGGNLEYVGFRPAPDYPQCRVKLRSWCEGDNT